MNLRDLEYFVTLAEEGHFGHAAERCHVSQPTLSSQIKKLEEELDTPLIERMTRGIRITAAGQEILIRARQMIQLRNDIRDLAQRYHNPDAGILRLGAFPTLAAYFFPRILEPLKQTLPQLELLLVEEKTAVLMEALDSGRLDAAILAEPVDDKHFEKSFLFEEPFLFAHASDHDTISEKVHLKHLADEPLLLLEEGHCLREQALEVCQLAGIREYQGFRATSLETLRLMVASGIGSTLLPLLSVLPPAMQNDNIELKAFADPAPSRKLSLVWRPSSPRGPWLRKLSDLMRETLRQQCKPGTLPCLVF